jgi:protein SCO1/2
MWRNTLNKIEPCADFSGRLLRATSIAAMRNAFFGRSAAAFCVILAIAGCNRSSTADSSARSYQVRGLVRGFAPDRSTVTIQHEDIPGFMPSMTMPFSAKDQKEIADLRIGDGVSFRMTVTDKDLFLDQVKKIPASEIRVAMPSPTVSGSVKTAKRLREGDIVPFFSLTNQDGAPLTSDTFRGRPFVLTFVFTRCPVPNFCPRMSNNFSELQDAIKSDAALAGKARLLSVTFDPAFDTPAILKSYAEHQKADSQMWTFATGAPAEIDNLTQSFAVFVQPEGGTISHGLATALVAPDRSVLKIWRGNSWQPAEVLAELRRAIK